MQQENIEGSQPDQKLGISIYQENLMTTCSELIASLTSEKSSEELSKTIKVEKSETSEHDDWISGFSAAITTNTTNETHVAVKQELQSGKNLTIRSTFFILFILRFIYISHVVYMHTFIYTHT